MIRRINIFGGPGSGKSTTAASVFSTLKKQILNGSLPELKIELVQEYVKEWA